MSTLDALPGAPPTPSVERRPRTTLLLLRIVLVMHAVAVVAQPVLIGRYLEGEFDVLGWHAANASLIVLLVTAQFVLAVLYWRPAGGRGWPALASVGLFLAEGLQTGMGYSRQVAVHIPLGVLIVVGVVSMAVWAFLPLAARPRPGRRGSRP